MNDDFNKNYEKLLIEIHQLMIIQNSILEDIRDALEYANNKDLINKKTMLFEPLEIEEDYRS
jgi:hypothetical protein